MASKKWIDYKKTLKNQLTDNVKANEVMSPFYFILCVYVLNYHHKIPFWNGSFSLTNSIMLSLVSTLVYLFASNYYQPDLDIPVRRPGMGHFPFGRWMGSFKYGRFLKFMAYPINRFWYYLWHPYGRMMTHRGFGHYPIIGVLIRTTYLLIIYKILKNFLGLIALDLNFLFIENWLLMFYPFNKNFASISWFLFCFPIYLSDIIHFLVDYRDSMRKGISFCPPAIPRGFLIKNFEDLKKILKK